MASAFTSVKCTNCAGTLSYNRAKKVWVCDYCGSEIVREERSEGPYSIKGVAVRALTDLAEGRLDAAQGGISECEKLDPNHISTLICRVCYNVLLYINASSGGSGQRPNIPQLKRDFTAIKEYDDAVSPEEEALYEAVGERADVFAILMLTFDTLGAKPHTDFVRQLLDVSQITSAKTNAMLLSYALKNNETEMASQITRNVRSIDRRQAFFSVLSLMEDGNAKRDSIRRLLSGFRLEPDDRKTVNRYLEESGDADDTKLCAFLAATEAGAMPSLEMIAPAINRCGREAELAGFVDALCEHRPTDPELIGMLDAAMSGFDGNVTAALLSRFSEKGVFLPISAGMLSRMLSRENLTAEQKCELITLAEKFKLDSKLNNAILSDYLLNGRDPTETRLEVLPCLIQFVGTPATATIESYAIGCTRDGERKPEIAQILFSANLNSSFLRDLPKKYMAASGDRANVKKEMMRLMNGAGMPLDANSLVEMACRATPETAEETAAFIRQSLDNGARLRSDAMSEYLEKTPPSAVNSKLISVLHSPGGKMSDGALANYVLFCHDNPAVKSRNALIFAEQNGAPLGTSRCRVQFHGDSLDCNLLQAYLLLCAHEPEAEDMLGTMLSSGQALNDRISVNGVAAKFHKYVKTNRSLLSPLADRVCEDAKLFSRLL